MVQRDGGDRKNDHGQRQAQVKLEETHTILIRLAGGRKKCDSTRLRRHNRKAHGPPGKTVIAQQVTLHTLCSTCFPYTVANDHEKCSEQDNPVCNNHEKE